MATFAIQAVHDTGLRDAQRVRDSLARAGSHFLTRAQWNCLGSLQTARLCVEADCEDEVRLMVPPVFRLEASVTRIG